MGDGYNTYNTDNLVHETLVELLTYIDEAENTIRASKDDKDLTVVVTGFLFRQFGKMSELALKLDHLARGADELKRCLERDK